jgi:inorganic triphosphatase YgiF
VNSGQLEAELKYTAADEGPLLDLERIEALGSATLGVARTASELDRYLDTADLRLSAARWACRLRSREGRTLVSLKGPAEHDAGELLHRRRELEGPAGDGLDPAAWPPSPARERIIAMIGRDELVERFRLDQQRTERSVSVGELRVGLLSLDRVRVLHGQEEIGRMLVVELELDPEAIAAGFDHSLLSGALDRVRGLVPDPLNKLERALALLPAR